MGKAEQGSLVCSWRGERTGLREGRSVPWPSKKKNEIPRERGVADSDLLWVRGESAAVFGLREKRESGSRCVVLAENQRKTAVAGGEEEEKKISEGAGCAVERQGRGLPRFGFAREGLLLVQGEEKNQPKRGRGAGSCCLG